MTVRHCVVYVNRRTITRAAYGMLPPAGGMVTFVDPDRVPGVLERGERVYGWCFKKAGFRHVGFTQVWKLWA